jgi:hypothetical protein
MEMINYNEVFDKGIIQTGNLYRIRRVMEKALSNSSVKIVFLGGSITAGAAASTPENCYAYLVYSWWKDKFPESKFEFINAGVGATTSKFGVARVQEDVLNLKPDMVFTEFCVNDEDNELYEETYEGLIRRILLDQSEPALFLFHNVFYDDGRNAQRIHSRIGKYYELPMVSMKESLYSLVEAGWLLSTDISTDHLHPNDFGHKLVSQVITNLLEKIYDKVIAKEEIEVYQVKTEPLTKNRYFHSVRHSNRNTEPWLKGFRRDELAKDGVWDVFRYGWAAKALGSSIRFETEGSMIAVQYRKYAIHPAPVAKVTIDQDTEHEILLDANFDETWGDKLFLQDIVIDGAPGKHTIEITLIEEAGDKEFYLAALITA